MAKQYFFLDCFIQIMSHKHQKISWVANIREFILETPGSIMDSFVINTTNGAPYWDYLSLFDKLLHLTELLHRIFFLCFVPESIICTVWQPNSNGYLINNLNNSNFEVEHAVNKTSATSAVSSTILHWYFCLSNAFLLCFKKLNISHSSPCTFQNWCFR